MRNGRITRESKSTVVVNFGLVLKKSVYLCVEMTKEKGKDLKKKKKEKSSITQY